VAPRELALSDLTMVVPVKNNQTGVTRLLEACLRVFAPNRFPAEILLVDNLSHPPVEVPAHLALTCPSVSWSVRDQVRLPLATLEHGRRKPNGSCSWTVIASRCQDS